MSLRRLFLLSLTFSFLALAAPPDASASKRVALVVGNNDYTTLSALNNAEKDARDMAQTLRGLGWEVVDLYNSSQRDMGRAISKFEGLLMTAEAGLFFYAGHGIQANGENWLVPIDADVEAEVDLRYEAIGAREVLRSMKNADVPVNIVILDACRDNPLKKRTRSASRGLQAPEVPSGLRGTTILFSAAPGEVAQDGPQGGNGVFTGKLLAELKRPGQTLEEVFKATARGVNAATNRSQMPWFNSSLSGDFYFNEAKPEPEPTQVAAVPPAAPVAAAPNTEIIFWQSVSGSKDPEVLRSYLKQYPDGQFAALAKVKISAFERLSAQQTKEREKAKEADFWKIVSGSKNRTALDSYLARYPSGRFAELARLEIKLLEKTPQLAAVPVSPNQKGYDDIPDQIDLNKIRYIEYKSDQGLKFSINDPKYRLGSFLTKETENGLFAGLFRGGNSVAEQILQNEAMNCLQFTSFVNTRVTNFPIYFNYWNKNAVNLITQSQDGEAKLELIVGGHPQLVSYTFKSLLKKNSNHFSFEAREAPDFDNLNKSTMGPGNVSDIRLRVSSTLDKKLLIAREIVEDWKICEKNINLVWRLKKINYLGRDYIFNF